MRPALALLASAALTVGGALAPAASAEDGPTFRTERQYAHCTDAGKVQRAPAAMNTTAPGTSFQAGAGCGFAGGTVSGAAATATTAAGVTTRAVFTGKFVGNLKAMAVELHNIAVGASRTSNTLSFDVTVKVGDKTVQATIPNVVGTVSSSRVSTSYILKIDGIGLASEVGSGTTSRDVTVTVDAPAEVSNSWVLDATEVPSGVTFNPAS